MLRISDHISIPYSELQFDHLRASGPGGQNVNKVASAVQLRFDLRSSVSLPEGVRQRAMALAGSRLTSEGVIVITAQSHRSQAQNRDDAIKRLVALIRKAEVPPRPRRATKPTKASQRRRLDAKKIRAASKRGRRKPELQD